MRNDYQTETMIRQQVTASLQAKRRKAYDPNEVADARYESWIQDRIEEARRRRSLVTPQQYLDFAAGRVLRPGDRVRYIGPTKGETSRVTGNMIIRNTGQIGTIVKVEHKAGRPIFHFSPDVPKQTLELSASIDIEILTLATSEWTYFERLP